MSTDDDRRIQGTTRIPFEALVEVGGELGPTFEAQAVDLSEEGMHLRTAYLPDIGQPLSCRFEAGSSTVIAAGEVVWREEAGRGGEFGIRFTNLDADSVLALDRIVGIARGSASQDPGARVRLHIEGLGSPMRARVKDSKQQELRVGSELGFLQVGKPLELEDAATGSRRAARIDRVDVETDAASHIPQLVVTLRYDDERPEAAPRRPSIPAPSAPIAGQSAPLAMEAKETTPGPAVIGADPTMDGDMDLDMPVASAQTLAEEADPFKKESDAMKGAFGRGAAKVGPALASFARRAMLTASLLARRTRDTGASAGDASPQRRTTAPAPGGGLHTSGRRVVRGESMADALERAAGLPKAGGMKRKVIAGSAIAVVAMATILVARRPAAPPPSSANASLAPSAEPAALAPTAVPPSAPLASANVPPPAPLAGPAPLPTPPAANLTPTEPPAAPEKPEKPRHVHVAPFGNGNVAHANVLHLKMDGPIEKLEGASTPTGFSVRIPNRRSLEAAAPLAARDGRIAAMHVTNDASGADLAVSFKDGVPNFQVRAKGDQLEILIAPAGAVAEDVAEAAEEHSPKHPETAASGTKKKPHHQLTHHIDESTSR